MLEVDYTTNNKVTNKPPRVTIVEKRRARAKKEEKVGNSGPINLLRKLDGYLQNYSGKERKSHYPSQASVKTPQGIIGKCLRAQWYSWKGEAPTNPIPISNIWKLRIGDSIHAQIARWLRKLEYQVKEEYFFEQKIDNLSHPIHGFIDDVIVFPDINEFYSVECKTSWSKFFTNAKDGVAKKGPRLSDLLQVLVYLSCVKELKGCYMLYVARDNGQRFQFYVELFEDGLGNFIKVGDRLIKDFTFDDVILRWWELESFLRRETKPPADYDYCYSWEKQQVLYEEYLKETKAKKPQSLNVWAKAHTEDWQCAYCEYWDKCKAEKEE